MGFHLISHENIYRAPAPAEPSPLEKLSIDELTTHAVELQAKADGLQRRADKARGALFRLRKQRITEGLDVPGVETVSGLPHWNDQARSELIAHDDHQIDVQAGRVR